MPEALELVDDLLRPLERERGNDDLAAALVGAPDDRGQLVAQELDRPVQAIAVGALGDQAFDAGRHLGVAQDRQVVAPEIAGEGEAQGLPLVLDVEHDDRAAQHVPRVEERQRDARRDGLSAVIGQADDLSQRLCHVRLAVKRLDGLEPGLAAFDQAGDVTRVGFLDHRRVEQHRRREIARRGRRVDGPVEAVAAQQRQRARVVDVRVRQHHRVERPPVDRDVAVLLERLAAAALKEAAVEQHRGARRAQEVLRAGHGLGRADELERDHGSEPSGLGGVRDFANAGVVGSGWVGSFACRRARAACGSSANENSARSSRAIIPWRTIASKFDDLVPVARAVEDDRDVSLQLARLRERQDLEELVERAEPAREHDQRARQVREPELAHEEVVELEPELGRDVRVRTLLVRQPDVEADRPAAGVRARRGSPPP